jgi:RNA polymerase sigma-70 factor (ECF subfamily)
MQKNHLTTDQIIQGCRKAKSACQKALVESYSGLLYTICLRYMGDEARAKDVLQESFIRIFKSFKSFDPNKGSLQAWMKKITINMALKSLDKEKMPMTSYTIELNNNAAIQPTAIEKMHAEDLMKVIQTLPQAYRQVFNLYVIEGYSHKEIAAMLSIEEVSSRSNLSRAKQLLRKKLTAFKKNESWVKII